MYRPVRLSPSERSTPKSALAWDQKSVFVDAVAVHGAAGIGDVFIKQVNGIGIGKIRSTGNVA
jgi:hypothetical protein